MSNSDVHYPGPVKKAYCTCCTNCGKEIDNRWNYCPACGAKIFQLDIQPFSSNIVVKPQSGQ